MSFAYCAYAKTRDSLRVYPVTPEIKEEMFNDDYSVRVRIPNHPWKDVFTYKVKVDLDSVRTSSMAYFDFDGTVEVSVTDNKDGNLIKSAVIRPLSYSIPTRIEGNTVFFKLEQPQNIVLEINGERFRNLQLFSNEIEKSHPDREDPNLIYFGPGMHRPTDKATAEFKIPEGKTVYVAGGAVVKTTFVSEGANNTKLIGRGVVDGGRYGLKISNSNNTLVKDLIFLNIKSYTIFGGNSDKIKIRNIRSITSDRYSDGIDLMSCNNVEIDNVFLRNSDDCLAFYGHRWEYYGGAENYKITNAVLWADVAHPIFMGVHGNPQKTDTLRNFRFENINILEHDEDSKTFQGSMAINAGDNTFIENVIFKRIFVEDFEEGQLFNLRVVKNNGMNKIPGKGIRNVKFEEIFYEGNQSHPSTIQGFDNGRKISSILFENVYINGIKLNRLSEEVKILDFVEQVKFK